MIKLFVSADWTAVERDKFFNFDLDSTPIQIQSKSADEGGDILRVRFTDWGSDPGHSVRVSMGTQPAYYYVSYCRVNDVPFQLPNTEEPLIWTFVKEAGRLKLFSNGVQIFDIYLSPGSKCKTEWSWDFSRIVFPDTLYKGKGYNDNASTFFRRYSGGLKSFHFSVCLVKMLQIKIW